MDREGVGRRMIFGERLGVITPGIVLILALMAASCSVPNLEQPECDEARDVVREFYSRHFGSLVPVVPNGQEATREYLTSRYSAELSSRLDSNTDPFTQTDDPPKAFRAGECRVVETGRRVSFELLLFWKTDTRTEQRSITVEVENQQGKWLIDNVTNQQTNDR